MKIPSQLSGSSVREGLQLLREPPALASKLGLAALMLLPCAGVQALLACCVCVWYSSERLPYMRTRFFPVYSRSLLLAKVLRRHTFPRHL